MKTHDDLMRLVHAEDGDVARLPPVVLVVEDHEDTLTFCDAVLSGPGYLVARAANGLQALEYAQDLRPDAILTDIGLPGEMTGADFIREVRADRVLREVPVVVMTGRAVRELRELDGLGIAVLLAKPVHRERLLESIGMALELSATFTARTARLAVDAAALPDAPAAPPARTDKKHRACPVCGTRLQWVETRRLQSRDYDYYRECARGCGLFCFDRASRAFELLRGGAGEGRA